MNVSLTRPQRSTAHPSIKWVVTALPVAVVAFLASPSGPLGGFWRPAADMPMPAGGQLPLLIALNVIEVVIFGLGIAFALFGYRLLASAAIRSRGLTAATYVAIVWLLVSWWPHDSLHVANGMALNGLIGIEYGFHVTCMLAGGIVALFFLQALRDRMPAHTPAP